MVQKTTFSKALTDHQVSAVLSDLDHYRIHGGMAVETDYIIRVESSQELFDHFIISKVCLLLHDYSINLLPFFDFNNSCVVFALLDFSRHTAPSEPLRNN